LVRLFLVVFSFLFLITCQKLQDQSDTQTVQLVVSLSPHITEIIFALGAQDKLVGISDFCTYPAETDQIERIGGLLNPNLEKLLGLKADLFIGTPAHHELALKLGKQNLYTILLANDCFEDIFTTIDSIGVLLNKTVQAQKLQQAIHDSLDYYLAFTPQMQQKPTALLSIGRNPGTTHKITASGNDTFIAEMWQKIGGINIFTDLPAKYAQISNEALLQKNPDLIIEFKFKEDWNEQKNVANKREWTNLQNLKAVQQGHIYVLNGDYTLIPGPRIYLLARDFQEIISEHTKGL